MLTQKEADVLNFIIDEKRRNDENFNNNLLQNNILFQGIISGIALCVDMLDLKISDSFHKECKEYLNELVRGLVEIHNSDEESDENIIDDEQNQIDEIILSVNDLEKMSVEEVKEYYNELQNEINRSQEDAAIIESMFLEYLKVYIERLEIYIQRREELEDMPDPDEI
jgi:hypothetical protein